jgi:hypothetical protein
MPITTNHVPRDVIDEYELSADERKEFDYLDWDAIDRGESGAQFFRYRGTLYDLGEFATTWPLSPTSPFAGWDGYITDSFFSGVVVKFTPDYEHVIVGLWLE